MGDADLTRRSSKFMADANFARLAQLHDQVEATLLLEDLRDRPWGLRDFRVLDPAGYYLRITDRAR